MDVSIIIVNYNTTDLTSKCVESIIRNTHDSIKYEIIVVDNNSPDQSIKDLEKRYPMIEVLYSEDNKGFGYANNLGFKRANGTYYFLLNPDAYLINDAISFFFNYMNRIENKNVGICGGELITQLNYETVSYGNFPTILELVSSIGFFKFYKTYYKNYIALGVVNFSNEIREVDFISGADMFIRSSLINKIGGFDEDFFLYFEEVELTYRAKLHGYKSYILPNVNICHIEGASQIKNDFNYNKYRYFSKSRNLFYKKAYSQLFVYIALIFHLIHCILFTLMGKESGNLKSKITILLNTI
jgi:GT2 family glycosyltransferase